jgi:spermidine synthase
LKHNTVEQVVLLSMDLNHTVRFDDFLRTEYQDDPRAKIVDEDGLKWFTESYSDNEDKDLLFDVIVVDMS